MLIYSRQCLHPIVTRDQCTNNSIYSTYVKYRSTHTSCRSIKTFTYFGSLRSPYSTFPVHIIPNVNPSIMLSGPFYTILKSLVS